MLFTIENGRPLWEMSRITEAQPHSNPFFPPLRRIYFYTNRLRLNNIKLVRM